MRRFNPLLNKDLNAPAIDICVSEFKKNLRLIGMISFLKYTKNIKKQERLHELLSFYQFMPYFFSKLLKNASVHSLEVSSDYAVFQSRSLSDISKLVNSIFTERLKGKGTLNVVRMGSPGLSYQKLRILTSAVDSIPDAILTIHNRHNIITLNDIRNLSKIMSELGYRDIGSFYKRLLKIREAIEEYLNALESKNIIDKYYLKSEILLKMSEVHVKDEADFIKDIVGFLDSITSDIPAVEKTCDPSRLLENIDIVKAIVKIIRLEDFIVGALN